MTNVAQAANFGIVAILFVFIFYMEQVAAQKIGYGLEMDFVTTLQTVLNAIMMEVIAVVPMLIHSTALSVYASQ